MTMRIARQCSLLIAMLVSVCGLTAGVDVAKAQSPPRYADPGVVPDDMLTLVVGTRFVGATAADATAKAQFTDARIPLDALNDTDNCIDQRALEAAQEYFTNLGRLLGKAGHYYFLSDEQIKIAAAACEKQHGHPPQAWGTRATKIIAFGRVVPTAEAAELEKSIR
jgi:hypothetical protein